jgi:hypothetical protein
MASVRKRFNPKGKAETLPHVYAELIAEVLAGTVRATLVVSVPTGPGRARLEYDDPNG